MPKSAGGTLIGAWATTVTAGLVSAGLGVSAGLASASLGVTGTSGGALVSMPKSAGGTLIGASATAVAAGGAAGSSKMKSISAREATSEVPGSN